MLKFFSCILRGVAILLFVCNSPISMMERKNTDTSSHLTKNEKEVKKDYFEIMQNEIVFTNTHYPVRFLFTGGLGPCVGLILQAGNWIAFAHLDGSPMIHALNKIINNMKSLSDHPPIEATIVTSRAPRESTFGRLLEFLNHNGINRDHIHHIKENTEDSSVIMDKKYNHISTNVKNPGIKIPITNPSWNLGQEWSRGRPSQYPLLKLIIQEENGEFIFNPDPIEKYLALRYSPAKTKPVQPENLDMKQEEDRFLQEKEEAK